MSATTDLLDRWKAVNEIESDYAAAKKLEVSRATISNWRNGGSMDTATVMLIARDLHIDERAALAHVNMDRPLTKRDRNIWSRYCARVCVAALASAAFAATVPDRAAANENHVTERSHTVTNVTSDKLLIMRSTIWRRVRCVAARFAAVAQNLLRGTALSERLALA